MDLVNLEEEQHLLAWYGVWLWVNHRFVLPSSTLMNTGDTIQSLWPMWNAEQAQLRFPEVENLVQKMSQTQQAMIMLQLSLLNLHGAFPVIHRVETEDQLRSWIQEHLDRLPLDRWAVFDGLQELLERGLAFEKHTFKHKIEPKVTHLMEWIRYLDQQDVQWRQKENAFMTRFQSPWRQLWMIDIENLLLSPEVIQNAPSVLGLSIRTEPLQQVMQQLAHPRPIVSHVQQRVQTTQQKVQKNQQKIQKNQQKIQKNQTSHTVLQVPHLSLSSFLQKTERMDQ